MHCSQFLTRLTRAAQKYLPLCLIDIHKKDIDQSLLPTAHREPMLKNTGIYKIILLQKPMLSGTYGFSFFIITWICSIKRHILLNLAVDSRVNTENVFLAFVLIQEWVKQIYIYRKEGSLHWLRFLTALHCSWSSSSWRLWGLSKFSVNFHFFSNGIQFYSCNGDGPIYCPLL